ncbi:MAG TPA: DUF692 domain-containing protein [Myxococcota bacterium]
MNCFGLPDLGLGLGLRAQHARELLHRPPAALGFLELLSENHLDMDGSRSELTDRLAAAYPVVLHGVSMNLGSVDPLDRVYLRKLAKLAERTRARWVSDHLCWTGVDGQNTHDLLPIPYTESSLRHVSARVRAAQDALGRRIALENPSTYFQFDHSTIAEAEFLARLCEAADCALLLDVNNVHVSAVNLGFDATAYLDALPADRVVQIHLAGHSRAGASLIDTHDAPVAAEVWALYDRALQRCGPVATLLEWDARVPALGALVGEVAKAAPLRARAAEIARAA